MYPRNKIKKEKKPIIRRIVPLTGIEYSIASLEVLRYIVKGLRYENICIFSPNIFTE
jgi:hypothetical protein